MLLLADVKSAPGYELIVERSKGWLKVNWHELWEYRDLLLLLVQRDFISRYKQTVLGPLWFLLQPVLTTAVFVIVFGRFAGIPTDGIPGPLFYLCGLMAWNYFSQNITTGGATFVNNQHLFSKVYFPRVLVPVSIVAANLVSFALQSLPFAAFAAYFFLTGQQGEASLTWRVLLLPLPLLQIAALSLGVSLWMAASTAKYRDLVHLTTYLTQIWMFATPVIYPLSKVSPAWRWLVWANPMSVPVETFRLCLLGRGTLGLTEVALSVGVTLVLLITGVALFQRVERTVVDSA